MSGAALSQVKENLLFLKSAGWFVSGAEPLRTDQYPMTSDSVGYREAAVLFLISYHQGKLHVLLTKRSIHVRTFKGQACLPGGTKDRGDASLIETALREAEEEIGLDRDKVEVICSLPPQFSAFHNIIIVTPVVALFNCPLADVNWTLNPLEVECAYWVPLELFLDGTKATISTRGTWKTIAFTYVDLETDSSHIIFGMTSHICIIISAMALNKVPSLPQYSANLILKLERERAEKCVSLTFSEVLLTREQLVRAERVSKL